MVPVSVTGLASGMAAVAAGVAVAFAHSRRAGFIVVGALAGLIALLLLVRIPHGEKLLVVLTLGLFLPLGAPQDPDGLFEGHSF